jgi:hypothetical protein
MALVALLLSTTIASAAPRTLLLVDDHDVLYHSGLRRAVVPLVRHEKNPLIPGKPKGQLGYCSTYRDPKTGKYQFWYQTTAGGHGVAYAESDDGIAWTLPALDIVKLDDPTQRNIVLTSEDHYGASVVVDSPGGADPQRRYKMAYWSIPPVEGPTPPDGDKRGPKGGVYVAFSADGIHWTKHPELVIRGAYGRSS